MFKKEHARCDVNTQIGTEKRLKLAMFVQKRMS